MKYLEKQQISQSIINVIKGLQDDVCDWVEFARVGALLVEVGINYKSYGFEKLRPFLNEFADILDFDEEVENGKPPVRYVRPKISQENVATEIEECFEKTADKDEQTKTVYGKVIRIDKNEHFVFEGEILSEKGISYYFNSVNWLKKNLAVEDISINAEVEFELKPPNKYGTIFPKQIRFKGEPAPEPYQPALFDIKHSHGEFKHFVYLKITPLWVSLSHLVKNFENSENCSEGNLFHKINLTYNMLEDSDFVFLKDNGCDTMYFPSGFTKDGQKIYLYCTKSSDAEKSKWYCDRLFFNGHVVGGSVFDIINVNWNDIVFDLEKILPDFTDKSNVVVKCIEERCFDIDSSLVWLKNGFLSTSANADTLYVPTGYNSLTGKELYICCSRRKGIKGYGWYGDCITYEDAPLDVYDKKDWLKLWAIDDSNDTYSRIANLTLEEKWSFGDRNDYGILRNYLNYTFAHQWKDGEVLYNEDKKYAAFNTGLPERNSYKYIYAFYEKIESDPKRSVHPLHFDPPYRFRSFVVADRGGDGKLLTSSIHPLPKPPQYFAARSATVWELDFNNNNQLAIPGYDDTHILIQRCDRIPLDFYQVGALQSPKLKKILNSNINNSQKYKEIREFFKPILDDKNETDPEVTIAYRSLNDKLTSVISRAVKKLSWNWRSVVPCYNPEREETSFLLPVSFCDSAKPDRAMIATSDNKNGEIIYRIHTVVPLEWAYLDARLVCRPESEWLAADAIN